MNLAHRVTAEALGTAMLLAAVVGSGIMGERLAGGNEAIALLANSLATGAALIAILMTVGSISGAHLNPVVSVAMATRGDLPWRELPGYLVAQFLGAVIGVWAAHAMFGLLLFEMATKARPGLNLAWSEFIATFGLLALVLQSSRQRAEALPYAVAAYITAAYWFTASTSFVNPAVTLARALTNTFTGIRIEDVPGFVMGQIAGGLSAYLLLRRRTARAGGEVQQ
ncbi:MAG: MIP/aquaporin family protein [Burkholderiales bacterium]